MDLKKFYKNSLLYAWTESLYVKLLYTLELAKRDYKNEYYE